MSVDQFLLSADTTDLNYPEVRPTLDLNFARTKVLDPRITFTRASGGSYVGADGLIKYAGINEARFDHDPATGESLGLLIEESRSNLLTWSESFDDSAWTKINGIVNQNKAIAPDGTLTADEIVTTLSADFAGRNARVTGITNGFHTISFYAKRGNTNWLMITIETAGQGGRRFWYNLQTGIIGSTISAFGGVWPFSAGMEDVGNGFYRCHITVNVTTVGGGISYFAMAPDGDGTFFSTAGNSIYLWGAQLEEGSFPTSYIPTQGSTRTRAADNASITGKNFSEWYRQDEGTIFANWSYPVKPSGFPRIWQFTEGAGGVENFFVVSTNLFNHNRFGAKAKNVVLFEIQQGPDATINQPMRSAMALKSGQHAYSGNGRAPLTNAGAMPSGIDRCWIGSNNGILYLTGHIRRLTYYPKRLPDSQLISLTR